MRLHRLALTAFGPFGGTHTVDFDDALRGRALPAARADRRGQDLGPGRRVLRPVRRGARRPPERPGGTLRSDHADPRTRTEVILELTVAGRRLEITRQPPGRRPKKRGDRPHDGGTKAQCGLRDYDAATGAWKDLSRSHQEIGEEISQRSA